MKKIPLFFLFFTATASLFAQNEAAKNTIQADIDSKAATYIQTAKAIWQNAELGYLETKSSGLLQNILEKEGFSLQKGVAEMPTAFVATFGSGSPTIGILAEFDALPGLSQDTVPVNTPITEGGSGHGCGHHLFGTASVAAAVSLKNWMKTNKIQGTIKLFGTPAEEGGGAKVYMARSGVFQGLDLVLHWHPSDRNLANPESCLAVMQGSFKFYGKSAHSAAAPDRGRSALDGVEAMNQMVNMMREHIPQESRIHYVIKNGGLAPNVVPDFAEVEYMVRDMDVTRVIELWTRLIKCANGAALGTETTVKCDTISGLYPLLPNKTIAERLQANLAKVGGIAYDAREIEFAKKIQASFGMTAPPLSKAQEIEPCVLGYFPASTDVGDVSWLVPTAGLATATWVPGTAPHSWQSTACGGMSIGMKAMINAAKGIAMTGVDFLTNPDLIKEAKAEWLQRQGKDFKYKALVGDIKPPLDYRKTTGQSTAIMVSTKNKYGYPLSIVSDFNTYLSQVAADSNKALIEIKTQIPNIALDIRYATTNNFLKRVFYKEAKAFARLPVVNALKLAQAELNQQGVGIKIYDGYRPYAVTVQFYELFPDSTYVASPWGGSKHNRGCALDMTLVDLKTGKELVMPTPYDSAAKESWAEAPVKNKTALKNRELMKTVMAKHGFTVEPSEWWHYNFNGWRGYPLMDMPFEVLKK
jgi:aminobenzoyl-glutamate utilization protein B